MTDPIEKLYIEPTSACNLNCSMCFRHSWIGESASPMNKTVIDALNKIPASIPSLKKAIFFGMGEPLFHPGIVDMVKSFSRCGIDTQILTNGTLLSEEMSIALIEAGLSMLWLSIDGFDRDSYEKVHIGSRYDKIIRNLTLFNKLRGECKLGITFVIMKENINEIEKINDFADRFGIDEINLSYAIPGSAINEDDTLLGYPYAAGKHKRVIKQDCIQPKRDYCPFVDENACFIKWNGDVTACMQLLHSCQTYLYEEKRNVFSKSYGNITESDLNSIWNRKDYTEFRERVKSFSFSDCTLCRGCDMRLDNKEDCMYNEFPTCGACLWAQGIARCP